MEDKPKKRKATPQEKAYFKEGKREIKGKKVKNNQMADRISSGLGPTGSTTGSQTAAKSQATASQRHLTEKIDFLENTRQGQKLQNMESKSRQKTGATNTPKFDPGVARQQMQDRQLNKDAGASTFRNSDHKKLSAKFGGRS